MSCFGDQITYVIKQQHLPSRDTLGGGGNNIFSLFMMLTRINVKINLYVNRLKLENMKSLLVTPIITELLGRWNNKFDQAGKRDVSATGER